MVRQQAIRLVPRSALHTTGPDTLVNADTIFWLSDTPTAPTRLRTATLLGHRVQITATLQSITWNFGDQITDTTHSPGTPYPASDPCKQARCPGYYSHTCRRTGHVTVTAHATWSGTYTVDGGPPQVIAGTVDGPATTAGLRVRQATVILVPDPTGH